MGSIHRKFGIVGSDAIAVSVGIAENSSQQHLVGACVDPWHEVRHVKGSLFDLREIVVRVTVQRHRADLDQRIIRVWPDFRHVERVESVVCGVFIGHNLHAKGPAGKIVVLDRLRQVAQVKIGVCASDRVRVILGEKIDTLVGHEVILNR